MVRDMVDQALANAIDVHMFDGETSIGAVFVSEGQRRAIAGFEQVDDVYLGIMAVGQRDVHDHGVRAGDLPGRAVEHLRVIGVESIERGPRDPADQRAAEHPGPFAAAQRKRLMRWALRRQQDDGKAVVGTSVRQGRQRIGRQQVLRVNGRHVWQALHENTVAIERAAGFMRHEIRDGAADPPALRQRSEQLLLAGQQQGIASGDHRADLVNAVERTVGGRLIRAVGHRALASAMVA